MSGLESASPRELAVLTPTAGAQSGAPGADMPFSLFGDDGFTFADFIDIINPLQHIPVLSTLYRQLTGDTIDAASRVMGGTLFGGPIGAVASLINVFVEENTGKDVGEHAVAFLTDEAPPGGTAVAESEVAEARFETASRGGDHRRHCRHRSRQPVRWRNDHGTGAFRAAGTNTVSTAGA